MPAKHGPHIRILVDQEKAAVEHKEIWGKTRIPGPCSPIQGLFLSDVPLLTLATYPTLRTRSTSSTTLPTLHLSRHIFLHILSLTNSISRHPLLPTVKTSNRSIIPSLSLTCHPKSVDHHPHRRTSPSLSVSAAGAKIHSRLTKTSPRS